MTNSLTIKEHFKRLADFSGNEDKASFWPYAGIAFLIVFAVSMAILIPLIVGAIDEMQKFALEHPDQVTETRSATGYTISVSGEHPSFINPIGLAAYLLATFGSAIILYAAAIARRLRDAGKSPFWGLMPVPFILYSSVQMPKIIGNAGSGSAPDTMMFFSVFFSNFFYLVALVALIILLALKSKALTSE